MQMFTDHPRSVGETYFQHMAVAADFGVRMFTGALCCLLHAAFPFLFERTASAIITELHDRMVTNRIRKVSQPKPVGLPERESGIETLVLQATPDTALRQVEKA